MKKYLLALPLLVVLSHSGYSAVCKFKQPTINKDICKTLNLDNKIDKNPFFMKNMNGMCGMNMQLSGLPDLSLKDYIPDFNVTDVCGMIKYVNGDKVINQINKFLKF
jgi:hypothetical protein